MAVTDNVARYREIARIGVGGMATVMLAEDTMLRRRVALKRVHAGGNQQAIARLRREALVGASLSHPNLVSIYDVETGEDGDLVIVMEYVAGETLRDAIEGSGGLPPAFALEVLGGVAAALDAIHARGIVHRDVKPANILLGHEGAIKLADLGIAVAADRTQITEAGVILGTFSYMAPEQLEGEEATAAVDVYALAVVAFEMLSGQKARPQANPVALAHAIATQPPPDLCAVSAQARPAVAAVLKRGMAADPTKRPRSAGELVERLRAAFGPQEDTAPEPPRRPPPPTPTPTPPAPRSAPAAPPPPVPRSAPAPAPAPRPRPAPVAVAPKARESGPSSRIAGVWAGRQAMILAGIAALGLAALAVALLDSGGKPSPARSAHARTGAAKTSAASRGAGAAATATAGGRSGGTTTTAAAGSGGGGVTSNPSASTPAGAVQAFYLRAARHDYAGAWTLADQSFRNQLAGYSSFAAQQSAVRSLTFQRAETIAQGASSATVAVSTTPVLDSGTRHCQGTVGVVRAASGSGWLLDQISISCA